MVLEPYSNSPCNFIGKLSNDPSSSVAVTGCLNQPGDKMHITLLSGIQSRSLIYSLDFDGQVTALENPTKYQTGMSTIHSFYGIKVSYFVQNYFQYRCQYVYSFFKFLSLVIISSQWNITSQKPRCWVKQM